MAAGIERFRAEAQSFGMECDPASRRGGWGSQEGMPPHLYYELFQDSHSTLQAHAVGGYGSFYAGPIGLLPSRLPRVSMGDARAPRRSAQHVVTSVKRFAACLPRGCMVAFSRFL